MSILRPITLFIAFSAGCLSFMGCSNETVEVDMGLGYFPVNIGHWTIYDVDSIYVNEKLDIHDTVHFKLKELIESAFVDNSGRDSRRIVRYKKFNDTLDWQLTDIWYATRTDLNAEKVEENRRFVKLVFPPEEGRIWNGNRLNDLGAWDYQYQDVSIPGTMGGIYFDSTLTVQQVNDFNLIAEKNYQERYAKRVGLIYKKIKDVEKEYDETLGVYRIVAGKFVEMRISSFSTP